MRLAGRHLVIAMCVGQLGNLLPHVAVLAVMPQHLMSLWALSGAEAGLMASAFAFGYMFAVPVLTALTERIDARNILLVGSLALSLATLALGLLAEGLWSATMIWALAGVGFAGAYMPGLKALTDRLPPGDASRSVTLYTSTFSVGVGLSFLVCQVVADQFGWRWAFIASGLGPFSLGELFLENHKADSTTCIMASDAARYADDFVILVAGSMDDAIAGQQALAEHLRAATGLELSPENCRIAGVAIRLPRGNVAQGALP